MICATTIIDYSWLDVPEITAVSKLTVAICDQTITELLDNTGVTHDFGTHSQYFCQTSCRLEPASDVIASAFVRQIVPDTRCKIG